MARLITALSALGDPVTTATLPCADSLPDPDCWVQRSGAEPIGTIGARLERWDPSDVLLVVEVSDETSMADLTRKAGIYGSEGFPVYWVVSPDVIYQHTEPTAQGYRRRLEYRAGDAVPVPHAVTTLNLAELLNA